MINKKEYEMIFEGIEKLKQVKEEYTFAEMKVIHKLFREPANITDIAKDEKLAKGTVSDIINDFESSGIVERYFDSDKKKVLARLKEGDSE